MLITPMIAKQLSTTVAILGLAMFIPSLSASQTVVRVEHRTVCGDCRIVVDSRMSLGSPDDGEIGGPMPRVVLGTGGRLYVMSDLLPSPGVRTYSADGRYLGLVGRPGRGPGEVGAIWRIAAGPNGDLYVVDVTPAVHVFGADGQFKRVLRGVSLPTFDPLVISDTLLALSTNRTLPPRLPDQVVHVYDTRDGTLLGGAGPRLQPGRSNPATVAPAVFRSGSGTIWYLERGSNVLEQWSLAGTLRARVVFDAGWHTAVPQAARLSSVNVGRVWEDPATGLIWVKSQLSDPSYRSSLPEPVLGQPFPRYYFDPAEMNGRYNTIISVIDLRRRGAVAHLYLADHVYQFIDDGRLVVMHEDESGYQWVELIRLRLLEAR